jgi:hypothetical protein
MFVRYYGGGVGHGDSGMSAGVLSNSDEAIYESPEGQIKPEDTEEDPDDTDSGDYDDGDSNDDDDDDDDDDFPELEEALDEDISSTY